MGLPDSAVLAPTSDVDINVVTTGSAAVTGVGKIYRDDVVLEVSSVPLSEISTPEQVLGNYHRAGSLRMDSIICDPTGRLRHLQQQVAASFADRRWIRQRCRNARDRVTSHLGRFDPAGPWHDQVTAWLFGTGVTTHVILVAALRNPTVRLRYLAAREALAEYGYTAFYGDLLDLLGCANLSAERAAFHLRGLAATFDTAAAAARTLFPFSHDITASTRRIAIDGSDALIRQGDQREAVFWMIATYARCHKILAADAPRHVQQSLMPAFNDLLDEMGITGSKDLLARCDAVVLALPSIAAKAEEIIECNPEAFDSAPLPRG
ncbi:hypothetical protein [Krasilnikovia sp. MM14-A1259]|uniref:hypothetical protein n=1 Tax=Krasilnikovia sp. MM14-A1259 TaxID=3373539 RepID=UPI00399C72AB